MRTNNNVRAIILKDDKILLIHRIKEGKEYWVFPGGGVEDTETIEEAVVREAKEETSTEIAVKQLLYKLHVIHDQGEGEQYFFLCQHLSGEPRLGNANEADNMKSGDDFYEPVWEDINSLANLTLYPLEIRDWLIEDINSNFIKEYPILNTIKLTEFRKN